MKNGKKAGRIVLITAISITGVFFFLELFSTLILLSGYSNYYILYSFIKATDTDHYFSGDYTEYDGGEEAYSYFPKPDEIGNYDQIAFRFWKFRKGISKESNLKKNAFWLELRYEKEEYEKILPEILDTYDLLNKEKYYRDSSGSGKGTDGHYYRSESVNNFMVFEDSIGSDAFLVCINDESCVIRFLYIIKDDHGAYDKRLNHLFNGRMWGHNGNMGTVEEVEKAFWEKYYPGSVMNLARFRFVK